MASAIKMDNPICLIENRLETGRAELVVNPEALSILSKIHQPVVVVSIIGMYRTGKSYLMNRLAGARKGFSLGSTIQSKTKGIWMWCVPHPFHEDRALVLLDTEGLGDVEKGDRKNDSKIFALAILLSSALVYNSMGTINQDALDKLKFVGELTELIKVKTDGIPNEEENFSTHFPIFIWAVRDFSLELKIGEEEISADDYLENALKLKRPERSPEDKEYNALRNRLRIYFGKRRCFVFDVPTDSRKQLKDLEQLPDDRLSEDFVAQSSLFCKYIFENAEVKRLYVTVDVNGHRLGELSKLYTDALNSSSVVCLEETVVSLAEMENKVAVQEATKQYEDGMKTVELPTDTLNQFLDLSRQYEDEAQNIFLKRSFKDKDHKFLNEFLSNVERKRTDFSFMNEAKSREVCEALIKKHSADFEKALAEGTFCKPGGHEKFKQGLKTIEEEYSREGGKGLKAEEVLHEYKMSKKDSEIIIIQEDNALSQRQKDEEEKNTIKQMTEMKERLQQLEEERKNRKEEDEKAKFQMILQQLNDKFEEERKLMNAKLEQVTKDKERERDLYLIQERKEQANKFDEQIRVLQSLIACANAIQYQDRTRGRGGRARRARMQQQNATPVLDSVMRFLTPVVTQAIQRSPACPPMNPCPPYCPPYCPPDCPP